MKRMAIPSSAVLLFTFMFATPVLAAPPSNDEFAGATEITGLPYTQTLDTSEATTDPYDAELSDQCGPPASEASVWYTFTAPADMGVIIDLTQSDYSAGVFITTGSPGAFGPIENCGPGVVDFVATAGTTYVLMVIDDTPEAGNGGTLVVSVTEAPPPPEIDISIDPVGTFDAQTGSVTLTGTVTCTEGAFAFIDASVSQRVGRFTVRGFGFTEVLCDGTAQAWTIEVFGDTGLFKGGQAVAVAFGQACTEVDCGFGEETATIRLRR